MLPNIAAMTLRIKKQTINDFRPDMYGPVSKESEYKVTLRPEDETPHAKHGHAEGAKEEAKGDGKDKEGAEGKEGSKAKVAPAEHTDPAFTQTFFTAALAIMKPRQPGKYGLSDVGGWDRLQNFMSIPTEGATGMTTKVDVKQLVTNELVDEMNRFDAEAVRKQAREYKF